MTVIIVLVAAFIFFKIIGKCSKPEKDEEKGIFNGGDELTEEDMIIMDILDGEDDW